VTASLVESLAMPLGVGGFAGFLVGYAIRKVIKLIFVLVGLGLAFVLFLQSKGILNVDYQKLDAFAQNVTSSIVNTTMSTTTVATHNTIPGASIIHSILSVPMVGGAAFGPWYSILSYLDCFLIA
jgi:uncharacterized membrane protein (Fun14 family)